MQLGHSSLVKKTFVIAGLCIFLFNGCKLFTKSKSETKGVAEGACVEGEIQQHAQNRDMAMAKRDELRGGLSREQPEERQNCSFAKERAQCPEPNTDACERLRGQIFVDCSLRNDEIEKKNLARSASVPQLEGQIEALNQTIAKESRDIEFCQSYFTNQERFRQISVTASSECEQVRLGRFDAIANQCICPDGKPIAPEATICTPLAPVVIAGESPPSQVRDQPGPALQSECPFQGWKQDTFGVCRPYGRCAADEYLTVMNNCQKKTVGQQKLCNESEVQMSDGSCRLRDSLATNGEYMKIDGDGDNIVDGVDRCPRTPRGAGVWSNGQYMGCAEGETPSY